jgi:acetyl/propionyl-CoA carboxylase alpha subunit
MLKVASGEKLGDHMKTENFINNIKGWALEARVYSEDPLRGFLPSNGSLLTLKEPRGACAFNLEKEVRVDSGLMEVTRTHRKRSMYLLDVFFFFLRSLNK